MSNSNQHNLEKAVYDLRALHEFVDAQWEVLDVPRSEERVCHLFRGL